MVQSLLSEEDATFIYTCCKRSAAKHWAQWWTKASNFKMLTQVFTPMLLETSNYVERQNRDSKCITPQPLKIARVNAYRLDKMHCCKHLAAEDGTSVSYCENDENA